jgi:hypothetical protein
MGATLDRARRVWGRADASEADKLKLQRLKKGIESMIETNILKYKQSAAERNAGTTNPLRISSGISFNTTGSAFHNEASPIYNFAKANGIDSDEDLNTYTGDDLGAAVGWAMDLATTSNDEYAQKFLEDHPESVAAYKERNPNIKDWTDKSIAARMLSEYKKEATIRINDYKANAGTVASNLYEQSNVTTKTSKNDSQVKTNGSISINPYNGVIKLGLTNGESVVLDVENVNDQTKQYLGLGRVVNKISTEKLTHQGEYIVLVQRDGKIKKFDSKAQSANELKYINGAAKRDINGNILAYTVSPDGISQFGTDANGNVGLMAGPDNKVNIIPLDKFNQDIAEGIVLANNSTIKEQ